MNTLTKQKQEIDNYANNPLGDCRTIDSIQAGQFVRQGDVYIVSLGTEIITTGLTEVADRQLAQGTSNGSRHTVGDEVQVYKRKDHGTVEQIFYGVTGFRSVGHVIYCKDRFSVMHPEHSDMSMPSGYYQIYHQVDASTGKRVVD